MRKFNIVIFSMDWYGGLTALLLCEINRFKSQAVSWHIGSADQSVAFGPGVRRASAQRKSRKTKVRIGRHFAFSR